MYQLYQLKTAFHDMEINLILRSEMVKQEYENSNHDEQ